MDSLGARSNEDTSGKANSRVDADVVVVVAVVVMIEFVARSFVR